MEATLQMQRIFELLDEPDKLLVLEVAKRFIPDHIATEEDLRDIEAAGRELASGDAFDWEDVNWK